jgi:NADH dehydrogenase (ubiquinone) Fe-S protein 3
MSAPTATVAAASSLAKYGNYLMGCVPQSIQKISVFKDELSLHVPPSSVPKVLEFLRDHPNCQYKQLMEMTAADYPTREHRFEIVYCLLSPHYNSRIIVRSYGGESLPVPSVSHLFSSAIWSEREAWDMFGVIFTGHPDLRRILTDYGFEGHPLRKDFPLTGFTEVRYDEEKKRIVQEPVELSQEFRKFDFPNPVRNPIFCIFYIAFSGSKCRCQGSRRCRWGLRKLPRPLKKKVNE